MKFVRPMVVISGVLVAHAVLLASVLWGSSPVPPPMEPPRMTGVLMSAPPAVVVQTPAAKPVEPQAVKPPAPPPEPRPPPPPKPKPKPRPEPVTTTLPPPKPAAQPALKTPVQNNEPAPQAVAKPATVKAETTDTLGAPVTPPRIDATARSNPAPAYPPVSRRRQEEGKVVLELLVKADGTVTDVSIKQSSGYARLDKAALDAVRRWRYTPAEQGGKPIAFRYLQPITFGLREH